MEIVEGLLLTAIIFIPLERMMAVRPQNLFRRHWLNDICFWIANSYLIGFMLTILVAVMVIAGNRWLPELHRTVSSQPHWLQFIEILLIADLWFYWAHRAMHAVPCLWRLHAIHHSIEDLDWLAGSRAHPLDQTFAKAGLAPVFLLGFSGDALGAFMLLYAWQSVFLHSNVRLRFGPGLRWLLASPEFHHWHHSKDIETRDKNFAGQLPILDVIFGTASMPIGRRPTSFGGDEPMRQNYLSQLALPFRSTRTASQVERVAGNLPTPTNQNGSRRLAAKIGAMDEAVALPNLEAANVLALRPDRFGDLPRQIIGG